MRCLRASGRMLLWPLVICLLLSAGCGSAGPPPGTSSGSSAVPPQASSQPEEPPPGRSPEESPESDSEADSGADSGEGSQVTEASSQPQASASSPEDASQAVSDPENTPEAGPETAGDEIAPDTGEITTYVYTPWAAGTTVYGNEYVEIDVSNAAEGYCHVRYTGGGSARIKVLITQYGGNQYQYNLNTGGRYEVFPFSVGSGTYNIGVYQNVGGNSYAALYSTDVSVSLRSGILPFLYANQQVNFWSGSDTVTVGGKLSQAAQNDLDKVSRIYNYVMNNIQYDYHKAATVQSGYIPVSDNILASGYGICFDYAAVMATMLRTQNIPTKVVVGYAGDIYHAWVSVYITDVGWVNKLVYFDGQSWQRMDPTFADNGNQSADIMAFIGNGANYSPIYFY